MAILWSFKKLKFDGDCTQLYHQIFDKKQDFKKMNALRMLWIIANEQNKDMFHKEIS